MGTRLFRLKSVLMAGLFITTSLVNISLTLAQTGRPKKSTTKQVKSHKINQEKPNIFDSKGKLITHKRAMNLLASTDTEVEQIYDNGKAIGARLRKNQMVGTVPNSFSFKTLNGDEIDLIRQQGRITVLNFWYVGCKPCLTEIPILNKTVEKFRDEKIDFFAITLVAQEDAEGLPNLNAFLEKTNFDFQIAIASKTVLEAFRIKSYPQTIVLDENGKIIFWRMVVNDSPQSLNYFLEKSLNL